MAIKCFDGDEWLSIDVFINGRLIDDADSVELNRDGGTVILRDKTVLKSNNITIKSQAISSPYGNA